MAMKAPNIPADKVIPADNSITKFNTGYMSLLDETRMPPTAAVKATNLIEIQDGVWATKWGSAYYGQVLPANCDGAKEYVKSDGSTELIAVAGGVVKKSTDGGAWSTVTGATLTSGVKCFFLQIRNYLYITNGTDAITRYDGTNLTQYTALATPAAPTPVKTGLAGTNYTYYYQVVAINAVGNSTPSSEASITVGKVRDSWDSTNLVSLTWTAVAGALRYDIYVSDQSGYECYLDSVAGLAYTDDGTVAVNNFVETPNDNTSGGPKFTQAELSGNRIWGTKDPNNPWRVYWAGVGQNTGNFSPFYGGGWIDLEKGGRERPYAVEHYRDGKGSGFATVWTADPQGLGSVWQISLDTVTIGTTSFIVPSATKVVGSIGSNAPRSVVKVGNDIQFANQKGVFAMGSRPSLLNVLSTDEISANIRTDWRNLTGLSVPDVAAYYFDAKVFWAVPYGNANNVEIWIEDIEKRNWQLRWTLPFSVERFLEYTDSSGVTHFLVVPKGGAQLIELDEDIQGDLGTAFTCEYKSPIIQIAPDSTKWGQMTYAYFDVSRLAGTVALEVLGTDKRNGFHSLVSGTVTGETSSNIGWSSMAWSTSPWSFSSTSPTLYTQSIVRKRLRISKLLNNYQVRITTSSYTSRFAFLRFTIHGFQVPTNDPQSWVSGVTTSTSGTSNVIVTQDGQALVI
jgi:hypothetical protein